jgi:hypothetical protein
MTAVIYIARLETLHEKHYQPERLRRVNIILAEGVFDGTLTDAAIRRELFN